MDKPQFIFDGTVEAIDIIQGKLGDRRLAIAGCYLHSRPCPLLVGHFHLFDVNYWFSYTTLTSATNRLVCMAARVSGLWSFGTPGDPLNGRALGESWRMARRIEGTRSCVFGDDREIAGSLKQSDLVFFPFKILTSW